MWLTTVNHQVPLVNAFLTERSKASKDAVLILNLKSKRKILSN